MPISVLCTPEFTLSPTVEAEWFGSLPSERRDEIVAWPDRRARHRSLIGARLLLEGLHRLGFAGATLASMRHPARSRPTLDLPITFSLSHCAGRIVCALSTCGAVGIDVEAVGPLVGAAFPSYLNPAERAWAGHSARRFYSVWTRKEAVAKAAGSRGLAALREIDTTPADGSATLAGVRWHTPPVAVGRKHVAHLAIPGNESGAAIECLVSRAPVRGQFAWRRRVDLQRRPVNDAAS